jgi:hypothetical protein
MLLILITMQDEAAGSAPPSRCHPLGIRMNVGRIRICAILEAKDLLTSLDAVRSQLRYQYDALNRVTNMIGGVATTRYTDKPAGSLPTEDPPSCPMGTGTRRVAPGPVTL